MNSKRQLVAFLSAHEDERAATLIEQQMALTLWGRRHVVESALVALAMSRKALDEAHGHFTQALRLRLGRSGLASKLI